VRVGRVRVGRTPGPRAAPFSPKDHYGGDACIGCPEFNGEFLAPALTPTAGDATCRQDRGARRRLVGNQAALMLRGQWSSGIETHRRTAGFPGQAVRAEEPHPQKIASTCTLSRACSGISFALTNVKVLVSPGASWLTTPSAVPTIWPLSS
jgi:hypothetical protein